MKTYFEYYQDELHRCLDIMNNKMATLSNDQGLFLLGLYETDQITTNAKYSDWYIDWVKE